MRTVLLGACVAALSGICFADTDYTEVFYQSGELRNDATTASITTLADVYQRRGIAQRRVIYRAFIPDNRNAATGADHRIFSAQGVEFWKNDALEFLDRYLKSPAPSAAATRTPP